jgi:hypothetical protein
LEKTAVFAGRPAEVDYPDDQAAVQAAKKVLDGYAIEIWSGARVVARPQPK